MVPKTEIYFAARKTASAHVYITKAKEGKGGKVRVNNVPIDMIEPISAREVILAPLEISGDLRNKIEKMNISIAVKTRREIIHIFSVMESIMTIIA